MTAFFSLSLKAELELTIVAAHGQPREDRAPEGAHTGVMEEGGVVEGRWGPAG